MNQPVTVRAWVTISVLALAALGAAAAVKVLSPIRAPRLVVVVSGERLPGVERGSCWPQRGGDLRCVRGSAGRPGFTTVPRSGTIRALAAYPVQPDGGTVRIEDPSGRTLLEAPWQDEVPYRLPPGRYLLQAEARYGRGAYVRYAFGLRVR